MSDVNEEYGEDDINFDDDDDTFSEENDYESLDDDDDDFDEPVDESDDDEPVVARQEATEALNAKEVEVAAFRSTLQNIKSVYDNDADEVDVNPVDALAALEWALRPEKARVGRKRLALTPEEKIARDKERKEKAAERMELIKAADATLHKVARKLIRSEEYGPMLSNMNAPEVVSWFKDTNIVDDKGRVGVKYENGYPVPRIKDTSQKHSVTDVEVDGVPLSSIQLIFAVSNYVIEKKGRNYVLLEMD